MSLRVIKSGPMALLQDSGRYGQAAKGMSPGGPMDEHAFAWANHLLGNDPEAAQIEITLGPFTIQAIEPTTFAITGADMAVSTEDTLIEPWSTGQLAAGETLSFKTARSGLRAYLAVKGGFQVAGPFGSCATVTRDELGGLHGDGSSLQAGDLIACAASHDQLQRQTPWQYRTPDGTKIELPFIPGLEFEQLQQPQRQQFLTAEYRIQADSNRMGYRLEGPALELAYRKLSEGQCKGAIQLPPNGQPIVLMADHQTIGGYPNLGCLTQQAISQLAQMRPGQSLRFTPVDVQSACQQRRQFEQFFRGFGRR